ncbi:MAG: hypothetical protein ACKV2T_15285 [Kofleriaceae bacterium]
MFRLALTSLAFPLFGCLAADGAGDEAIYIAKAVAASGESCSFSSSPDSPFIGHGLITAFSPAPYLIHPQLRSKVSDSAGADKTIQIHGARISLDFQDDAIDDLVDSRHKKFQSLFSAPLAPNEGSATDTSFTLVPEGALEAIAATIGTGEDFETEVVGKIVVYGDLAGDEVTSQEFRFPVTICSNCVTVNRGTCPLPAGTTVRAGNACNPFQDGVVDCCSLPEGILCPAVVAQN